MLIGLCGPTCSGKRSVIDFLIENYKFTLLSITPPPSALFHPNPEPIYLDSIDHLDTYVSEHWRNLYVIYITHSSHLDTLQKRPWFLSISLDAPLLTRYNRHITRLTSLLFPKPVPSLSDFIALHDQLLYTPPTSLATLSSRTDLRILNSSDSLDKLHTALRTLNLLDPSRLRPSWDQYFMQLADLAARRSNCMKRLVGCVIVREKRVISTGYNGTPRNVTNCNEGGCPRCNGGTLTRGAGLNTCLCLHAEENALLEAGRERIGDGAVLYCNTCPCLTCSVKIVQVGISEVVYSQSYHMDAAGAQIFAEAGVRLRQFSPPRQGLVNLC